MYCRSSWTWFRPWHSCGQLPRACRQFMVGEIARTSQRVQDASNVQLRMVLTAKERRREETGAEQPTTNIEPAFVELRAGRHPTSNGEAWSLNLERSPLNTLNMLKEMHSVLLAAFGVCGRELRGKSRNGESRKQKCSRNYRPQTTDHGPRS